jgi:hypothetical protein
MFIGEPLSGPFRGAVSGYLQSAGFTENLLSLALVRLAPGVLRESIA